MLLGLGEYFVEHRLDGTGLVNPTVDQVGLGMDSKGIKVTSTISVEPNNPAR